MPIPITVSTALALVLALPFWLAAPAQAFPVSFNFSGVLKFVGPQLGPPPGGIFQNENPFSGNFTYESSTMAAPGIIPPFALYSALTDFRVTIQVAPSSLSNGTITFTTTLSSPNGAVDSVEINNQKAQGGSTDLFAVRASAAAGLGGSNSSNLPGLPVAQAIVRLLDFSATVFGPDNAILALPTNLNLSQFDDTLFVLSFDTGPNALFAEVGGPLSTLEPVPEPATLLLFGSTMAGLGLAGWRRRRQQ